MTAEKGFQDLDFAGGELRIDGHQLRIWHGEHRDSSDTGVSVWDGSVVLAKYIELQLGPPLVAGRAIVELGAGCGLAGLAAGLCGAAVTCPGCPGRLSGLSVFLQ
jgi:hypothetical protein